MLPYTAEVLFSLFGQYNAAIFPLPFVSLVLAAAVLVLLIRPAGWTGRAVAGIMGAFWIWTGAVWHMVYFSPLNFAAPAYGAFFLVQGFLLLWTGVLRGRVKFEFRPDTGGYVGLAFAIVALALYPLAGGLSGHGWTDAPVVGIAPAPTVLFTLGVLLTAMPRTPWRLAVIPVLWCVAAGATGWTLGMLHELALAPAGAFFVALAAMRNRLAASRSG